MTCNIDLHRSHGIGGISNYIRQISSNINQNSSHEFNGCSFWYKKISRIDYCWFNGPMHLSVIPERLVYSSPFQLPVNYETLLNSPSDLNIFLTYQLPNVKFKAPVVSTIHDIILLKTDCEPRKIIETHKKILNRTINQSKYILTVSEASKRDLIEYFGINSDNIFIIHNGIDQEKFRIEYSRDEIEHVIEKYDLPNKFILNLGSYRKHKNIERLIEAYASLPKTFRQEIKLVLTNSHSEINNLIEKFSLNDDVRFIGFVAESDKPIIFKLASLTYYASLYEGFGVPIIESQAVGTPVLTSKTSSLPEAAGGAAILVDPYDVEEIASSIEEYFNNKKLKEDLISKGWDNAKLYTWERSRKEFNEFLNSLKV